MSVTPKHDASGGQVPAADPPAYQPPFAQSGPAGAPWPTRLGAYGSAPPGNHQNSSNSKVVFLILGVVVGLVVVAVVAVAAVTFLGRKAETTFDSVSASIGEDSGEPPSDIGGGQDVSWALERVEAGDFDIEFRLPDVSVHESADLYNALEGVHSQYWEGGQDAYGYEYTAKLLTGVDIASTDDQSGAEATLDALLSGDTNIVGAVKTAGQGAFEYHNEDGLDRSYGTVYFWDQSAFIIDVRLRHVTVEFDELATAIEGATAQITFYER